MFRRDGRTLSTSIRIDAPPEVVWNLISTLADIPDWYDNWDTVETGAADGRLRVDASFRLTRRHAGGLDTALCRVTSLDERKRLCWVELAPDRPAMSVEFRLGLPEDASPTVTLLHHTVGWASAEDRLARNRKAHG
jgi:uncharacterized protein YndB with AHSA1/START domain